MANSFNRNGGFFSPPGYMKVETGGSHDENPNGGVQIGVDQQGIPNMLEEGEPVYDDYVFSDNIKADKKFLKQFHLPEKYAGKLYSEIADLIVDEAEDRPLDAISNAGLQAMLGRLADAQEAQKQEMQEKELAKQLENMSPEELAQLEAMLSQQAAQEQQVPEEAMVQQPIPQEQVAPEQMMMQPEQAAMPVEQQVPYAMGGELGNANANVFYDGGFGFWDKVRNYWTSKRQEQKKQRFLASAYSKLSPEVKKARAIAAGQMDAERQQGKIDALLDEYDSAVAHRDSLNNEVLNSENYLQTATDSLIDAYKSGSKDASDYERAYEAALASYKNNKWLAKDANKNVRAIGSNLRNIYGVRPQEETVTSYPNTSSYNTSHAASSMSSTSQAPVEDEWSARIRKALAEELGESNNTGVTESSQDTTATLMFDDEPNGFVPHAMGGLLLRAYPGANGYANGGVVNKFNGDKSSILNIANKQFTGIKNPMDSYSGPFQGIQVGTGMPPFQLSYNPTKNNTTTTGGFSIPNPMLSYTGPYNGIQVQTGLPEFKLPNYTLTVPINRWRPNGTLGFTPDPITGLGPYTKPPKDGGEEDVTKPEVARGNYSTLPRYAGIANNLFAAGMNTFQPPHKFSFARASAHEPNVNLPSYIDPEYRGMDENRVVNNVLATNAGDVWAALNSGAGPGISAMLPAIDSRTTRAIGEGIETVAASNNQARNAVNAQRNNNIAQRSKDMFSLAMAQASARAMADRINMQPDMYEQIYNNQEQRDWGNAVGTPLYYAAEGLAHVGNENFIRNSNISNPLMYFWQDETGDWHHKAPSALGGYILLKPYK